MIDAIKHIIVDALSSTIAHFLGVLLIAGISAIGLQLFNKNKTNNVKYIESALKFAKFALHSRLGEKTELIFSFWLQGLQEINEGTYTEDEAILELVNYIQKLAIANKLTLNETEVDAIKSAATLFIHMLNLKSKTASKVAVKNLSINKGY